MARPSPASAGGEGEAAAADQEHRLEDFRRAYADMLTDTALPTHATEEELLSIPSP